MYRNNCLGGWAPVKDYLIAIAIGDVGSNPDLFTIQ